jgi:hypothetical protein
MFPQVGIQTDLFGGVKERNLAVLESSEQRCLRELIEIEG